MNPRSLAALTASLLGPAWLSAQPAANGFDHGAFDRLLRRHVTDGRVDYRAIGAGPELRGYLDALGRAEPERLSNRERLAFWINAYNAHTIALVHAKGETRSIRNIASEDGGPWRLETARVGGRVYSLDEIEHQVIRPVFREPRIHFALVCAAVGCPPLRSEAYAAERLEEQLEAQARAFVRSRPHNRVDAAAGVAYLSPIFDWFRGDFGGDDASIQRYVARYLPAGPEKALLESGQARLAWTDYDWSLNARP